MEYRKSLNIEIKNPPDCLYKVIECAKKAGVCSSNVGFVRLLFHDYIKVNHPDIYSKLCKEEAAV